MSYTDYVIHISHTNWLICMCYTDTKSDNEPRKKKNLTSTAKNHGGGVDGLNRANEG